MNGRKIEIGINHKFLKKNDSPKSKNEYFSKILNKKDFKPNKSIIKKFDFYLNEKKSPSKANIFDDKMIKNNIIKKTPKKINVKKRQNNFFKKKLKEREHSNLNSNLSIYKIINSKEKRSNKMPQQSSSITTDSMNSYISNASNKINNNKCISLLEKNDNYNYNSYNRERIDSDISNNSNNKNQFYINKE